jgi:hypothetical protein
MAKDNELEESCGDTFCLMEAWIPSRIEFITWADSPGYSHLRLPSIVFILQYHILWQFTIKKKIFQEYVCNFETLSEDSL